MSIRVVFDLLDNGAEDRKFRVKYDNCFTMENSIKVTTEDDSSLQ